MVEQDLPARYIDKQKLGRLWLTHPDFKGEKCRIVTPAHEFITIEVPREMTPDEISSVYYDKFKLEKMADAA